MWQPKSLDVQLCWTIKLDQEMRDRVWLKAYALEDCRQSSRKWKEWSQKYIKFLDPILELATKVLNSTLLNTIKINGMSMVLLLSTSLGMVMWLLNLRKRW
jgi:hypothetical protein